MTTRDNTGRWRWLNGAFLAAMCGVPAWAAWPIYRSPSFVLAAAVAIMLGATIALLRAWRRWRWWAAAALAASVFLIVGLPVTVPTALPGLPSSLPDGYLTLLRSIVTGWRDLLTLQLPVGNYQGVLVPGFLVLFGGSIGIWTLGAWPRARYGGAAAVSAAMVLISIALGPDSPLHINQPIALMTTHAALIGLVTLGVSMAWLLWRSAMARRGTYLQASSGRLSAPLAVLRKLGMSAGMIVIALVVAGLTMPVFATGDKVVLRTHVQPPVVNPQASSPLPGLRAYFADAQAKTIVLRTEGVASGTVVTLATLPYYDGTQFRATSPDESSGAFARLPYRLEHSGSTHRATVTIEHLASPWVPFPGQLVQINFAGARALQQARNFAYSAESNTGVSDGLSTGATPHPNTRYTVEVSSPSWAALDRLRPPSVRPPVIDFGVNPSQSLNANIDGWLKEIQSPALGSKGSATYVHNVIARVYWASSLSRSSEPIDVQHPPQWVTNSRMDPNFVKPSYSGENLQRINAVFEALLHARHQCTSQADQHCAVVYGDEEQLAAASAYLARYLGFNSRVSMGWPIENSAAASFRTLAWADFGNADAGQWYSERSQKVRTDNAPPVREQHRQFKKFQYVPEKQNATTVPAPDARPAAGGSSHSEAQPSGSVWDWLLPVVKAVGIGLLLLIIGASPFVVIAMAKVQRRKARRTAPKPADRIAGGWDEYVDMGIDYGLPTPGTKTRHEVAAEYDTEHGEELARIADQATFGPYTVPESESSEYWLYIDYESKHWKATATRWQRLKAQFNLRSFMQQLSARQTFAAWSRIAGERVSTWTNARRRRTVDFTETTK